MLAPATVSVLDSYWAEFLGCTRQELRGPHPVVLPHGPMLADYAGVYLQSFGQAPVISAPARLLAELGSGLAAAAQPDLEADARWSGVLGPALDRVVGPGWIGYADAGTLRRAAPRAGIRVLTRDDVPALDALRRAAAASEWEHGGSSWGEHPLVGAFQDGGLAAVAGYEVWAERIAHIAIITHPLHRGQGWGRAAVGRLAELALDHGLVPQYRTLAANGPARAVAAALGFHPYATSLALRLRDGAA